jgi:hypothetical protein
MKEWTDKCMEVRSGSYVLIGVENRTGGRQQWEWKLGFKDRKLAAKSNERVDRQVYGS